MIIDKIGGVNLNKAIPGLLAQKKTEERVIEKSVSVSISKEAIEAADADKVRRVVLSQEDPARVEKLNTIQQKLANNEYAKLSDEQLDVMANSILKNI